MKLTTVLNSINYDKKPLFDEDEQAVKFYQPFIVNKCLSYFTDTIFHSNAINCCPWLDKKQQIDFYRFSVRKKKRYSEWVKKEVEDNIDVIKQAFNYTDSKAVEVLNIIDSNSLDKLKKHLETGGNKNI